MPGPEIILVEDDANVTRLLRHGLQREQFPIRSAASIAEGRALITGGRWDILLLDRRLPDGDGIELCNEVRDENPHGYIIMLSGESTKEARLAGFSSGADDYLTKPFQVEELVARVRAGWRIVELQKALLASNRQLEELSRTDPLTGLCNRRAFDQELTMRFEHARRYTRPLAVCMIDIDHFKPIDAAAGHKAGDEVLQRVASVLDRYSRKTDLVARYGGEEFVIVLPETPRFEALQFGEKIRALIAAERAGTRVTVSIGIAAMPHTQFGDAGSLLRAADEALDRARERGRNRVECELRVESVRTRLKRPMAG